MTETALLTRDETAEERTAGTAERDWRNIQTLLDANELTRDRYEVQAVGEAGYAVRLLETPVVRGNDTVLLDLDDTIIAYSEARKVRLLAYEYFTKAADLDLDAEACGQIMGLTDVFARWIGPDGRDTYNLTAHMASLGWMSAQLQTLPPEARTPAAIEALSNQLSAAKQPETASALPAKLPFVFDSQFILTDPEIVSPAITKVFEPMLQPERYQDSVDAMRHFSETAGGGQQVNQIILTYGTPEFQLAKCLALLDAQAVAGKPLAVSQIWLTRKPKGDFIAALGRSLEDPAEAAEGGVAQEVFGHTPHAMILVDDAPSDLTSFENPSDELPPLPLTALASLRYRRLGTKRGNDPWQPHRPLPGTSGIYNAPEATNGRSLADEVYAMLAALTGQHLTTPGLDPELAHALRARQAAYNNRVTQKTPEEGSLSP